MNQPSHSAPRLAADAVALVGTFFILAGLIWLMYYYTRPGPVDQAHWAERKKNLAGLRANNKHLLENYAWIDAKKDWVRLPLARAMELTALEWQNPAAGRSNLLARLERTAPTVPGATNNAPMTNAPAAGVPAQR